MSKPKSITLMSGERIVAVVPTRCSGPGWANSPTWVYIAANDGTMRQECIQPEERTPALQALFSSGDAMCAALLASVPVKKINRKPKALAELRASLDASGVMACRAEQRRPKAWVCDCAAMRADCKPNAAAGADVPGEGETG